MLQIQENHKPKPFSLFNLGFRPFFLGGAVCAVVLMLGWIAILSSGSEVSYYNSTSLWHSHEMLFGFGLAIVAGFLLTAVRNWTNVQTPFGWSLVVIFSVWLLGRVVIFLPAITPPIVALVDLSFAPVLAVAIATPIIKSRNIRNSLFVPILVLFFIANLLVHSEMLGWTKATADAGIHLGLFLIIALICIIGGRVIPFFTERGVEGVNCKRFSVIEKLIIPATATWLLISFSGQTMIIAGLSFLLATMNLIRSYGWFNSKVMSNPLVWILHLGYLFISLGFFLYGLAEMEFVSRSIALHTFTAGAIGGMTLGMMARVSLGHTGRKLEVGRLITIAFYLIIASTLVRISITLLPLEYMAGLHISGTLWVLAWLPFLIKYTSILIKPRADGLFG